MSHVINHRALTGEKLCINKAIHALLMHGYATFNMIVLGPQISVVMRCVLPGLRMSIVCGNYVRKTSVKRRNKIVQEITRNVANVFSFYAIITIEHVFSMPSASVFNTSHRKWRMLMHEKPCLIPIISHYFQRARLILEKKNQRLSRSSFFEQAVWNLSTQKHYHW